MIPDPIKSNYQQTWLPIYKSKDIQTYNLHTIQPMALLNTTNPIFTNTLNISPESLLTNTIYATLFTIWKNFRILTITAKITCIDSSANSVGLFVANILDENAPTGDASFNWISASPRAKTAKLYRSIKCFYKPNEPSDLDFENKDNIVGKMCVSALGIDTSVSILSFNIDYYFTLQATIPYSAT